MHIINFLGLAGNKKVCYKNLQYLGLKYKQAQYLNTTDLFLDNFKEASFTFLGTKKSIDEQKEIFKENKIAIALLNHAKEIDAQEPSLIFDTILKIIEKYKNNNIILDITHGFRTLPLIASFGAIFGKINYTNNIKIIFAQEIKKDEIYSFISLEEYLNISVLAVLLNTFSKTLNLIRQHYEDDLILALESFSHSLHANTFKKLFEENLIEVRKQINIAKNNPFYFPLNNILFNIENILERFENIKDRKEYEKYFYIGEIMHEKNYYLASATYIFEGLSRYVLNHFKELGMLRNNDKSPYFNSQIINAFVLDKNNRFYNKILHYKKARIYRNKYSHSFKIIRKLLIDIRDLRNNITHISQLQEDDIKENLSRIIKEFKLHIINNKILPYNFY